MSDFQYLDSLLAFAKRLDKDLQDLVTTISFPPATPNPALRTDFLNSTDARCEAITTRLQEVELNSAVGGGRAGRQPSAEELIDAAGDAVLQMQRQCESVMTFLSQYGYTERVKQEKPTPASPVKQPIVPPILTAKPVPQPIVAPSAEPDESESPSSPQMPTSFALPVTPKNASSKPSKPHSRDNSTSPPDSPVASLEDLGLSSLSLGLLAGVDSTSSHAQHGTPSDTFDSPAVPIPQWTGMSDKYDSPTLPVPQWREPEGYDSPAMPVPEFSSTKWAHSPKTKQSDSNSMFEPSISLAADREFASLPDYLKTQMTLEFLNDTINEINDLITDKRFKGDEADEITIDEVIKAACIDAGKAKAVLLALLQLRRLEAVSPPESDVKRYKVI